EEEREPHDERRAGGGDERRHREDQPVPGAHPLLLRPGPGRQFTSPPPTYVAYSGRGISWRRSTVPHTSTCVGARRSLGRLGATYQSPRSSSSCNCPGAQPV